LLYQRKGDIVREMGKSKEVNMAEDKSKLSIYIPPDEEFIVDALEKQVQIEEAKGNRTNLSHEARRAMKKGLGLK